MEGLFWSFVIVAMIGYFIYKATKIGMIDDAINFVKHEILKIKR
jgi:hypothetical protein